MARLALPVAVVVLLTTACGAITSRTGTAGSGSPANFTGGSTGSTGATGPNSSIDPTTITGSPASLPGGATAGPPAKSPATSRLDGYQFWVDPSSPAAAQAATYTSQGQAANAKAMAKIAAQPEANWVTSADLSNTRSVLDRAAGAGKVALLVVYDIPRRDCGSYSAGGAGSADAYRAFIRSLAAQLGSARVVIVLEPDAIAQAIQGCSGLDVAQRYSLLSDAVTVLKADAQAKVYLDAGNPAWVASAVTLAAAVRASGAAAADGFALNVSNFEPTAANITYGNALSAQLGGAHYVIDTSRNGSGPLPANSGYTGPAWCNPPGRTLGAPPTTTTGSALVDGYLWVKRPGESDGDCGLGDPTAGAWWPAYALQLAG